jgi:transaldolase
VWLDDVSRAHLVSGQLAAYSAVDAVHGVRLSPLSLTRALADSHSCDADIVSLADVFDDADQVLFGLMARDAVKACDATDRAAASSIRGVAWAFSPVADDATTIFTEAKRLHAWVDRPNLFASIPATVQGMVALEEAVVEGISVEATPVFSLARHRDLMDAYVRGLERRLEAGSPISGMAGLVSVPVQRLDVELDRRLGRRHPQIALGAAIACLAYRNWKEVFSGPRWETLARRGARPQYCMWLTGAAPPSCTRGGYRGPLVAPATVSAMAEDMLRASSGARCEELSLEHDVERAEEVAAALSHAGVDLEDVVTVVEQEESHANQREFERALEAVTQRLQTLTRLRRAIAVALPTSSTQNSRAGRRQARAALTVGGTSAEKDPAAGQRTAGSTRRMTSGELARRALNWHGRAGTRRVTHPAPRLRSTPLDPAVRSCGTAPR